MLVRPLPHLASVPDPDFAAIPPGMGHPWSGRHTLVFLVDLPTILGMVHGAFLSMSSTFEQLFPMCGMSELFRNVFQQPSSPYNPNGTSGSQLSVCVSFRFGETLACPKKSQFLLPLIDLGNCFLQ